MHETTAEEAARAAVPGARRTGERKLARSFPLRQKRAVKALMARSRTGSILLSSSQAFRVLMVGSSISMFGSRISTVAFPMLVLHLNNSAFTTGLVAFAVIAPSILFYMPAGALVDRWNPRRVMFVSEILRGLIIFSVVVMIAIFGQRVSIGFLIPAMVSEEILEIFFTLADRRYLSGLMERDNMASRQAYVEVRAHAVILAGRPLGPFLFVITPLLPFAADAVSFLASIASLVAVRRRDEPVRKLQRVRPKQLVGDIGQGYGWLRKDRHALRTVFLMAATSLVAQALILMFLSEAHSRRLSTLGIGIVLAASGAGGAVGSLFSRFLPDKIRPFWFPIQMLAWAVALAVLTMAGGLTVDASAVAMLILGLTGAIGNIEFGTYLVSNVADDMIAKVTGIGQMLAIGACALGPVVGGFAIQRYGAQGAVEFLLAIVVALVFLSVTPEIIKKMANIYHSASPSISFARSHGVSLPKPEADSVGRNKADRIKARGQVPAAVAGGQEPSREAKGTRILEHSGISA